MAEISEIVQVTIDVQDAAVAQASFNKILIAGYHTVGSELIRDYTSKSSFDTDFAAFPGILAAGNAFFSQDPHPTTVSVGRLTTASTKKYTITPVAANSTAYTLSVAGSTVSYTSDATATVAEICAGLTTAINALSAPVTATDNTTSVAVDADAAGYWFNCYATTAQQKLSIKEVTTGGSGTVVAELTAITVERDDFYGVTHVDHDETTIANVAAWTEARTKLFGTSTSDPDALTSSTTDVLSDLETAAYDRTFSFWHQNPGSFPEVAAMAHEFPFTPGSRTFFAKSLAGISATDSFLTGTNVTNLNNKNTNTIRTFGGIAIIKGGQLASGRFIDVEMGIDWLRARMEERIYSRVVNLPKLSYTNAGLAVIEAEVRAQLQEAIREDVIADDENLSVTVLPVSQQSTNDRAARIVRGIEFKARLAGAIHQIFVEGVVFP